MDYSKKGVRFVWEAILNVLYPPLCAHCQIVLSQRKVILCKTCLEQISLLDWQSRCQRCFAELSHGKCERCFKRHEVIHRQIAACEGIGPSQTLLNGIHSGREECLSSAASLMAYQWLILKMPLPDLLVPIPSSFWIKQSIGFDPHDRLTNQLSQFFSAPVQKLLRRKFDRNHFLNEGEFQSQIYPCVKKQILCDRHILLIATSFDDVLFRQVGNELKPFFPKQIDALSFCL